MKKKIVSVILVIAMGMTAISSITVFASSNPSSWAVAEVNEAKTEGLVTDSVMKDYQANITREQFCEMVVRAYEKISGEKAEIGNIYFSDTDNVEILKAANLGIVTGYGNNIFGSNDLITREQIAAMLARMIDKSASYANINVYNNNKFNDGDYISQWAIPSVNFTYDKGIMQGVGDNCIDPQANTTCEQAILLVYRTVNKYYDEESQLDSVYELTEEHIAQDDETFVHYTDNIILAFIERGLSDSEKEEIANVVDGDIVAQLVGSINLLQIQVEVSTLDELDAMAEKLMKNNIVYYATADILTNSVTASDFTDGSSGHGSYAGENEWWVDAIEARYVWNVYSDFIKSSNVGVVDSVIDNEHEDLKNKISFANDYYKSYNSINLANEVENVLLFDNDDSFANHGTMISGIISADRNDKGMSGVSNKSNIIFAAFQPNEMNWNSITGDLYALKTEIEVGAVVINESIQSVYYDRTYYDENKDKEPFNQYNTYGDYIKSETASLKSNAMVYAATMCDLINSNKQFIVVQCAGNGVNNSGPGVDARFAGLWAYINSTNSDYIDILKKYDVSYSELINRIMIVGAVKNEKNSEGNYIMTDFSNYGVGVDICAPGENIYSCCAIADEEFYDYGSGTSEATPMVTGTAAVLWGIDPTLTAAQVKDYIIKGAKCKAIGVGVDQGTEYPMLNVRGAVEELLRTKKVAITVSDKDANAHIQDATVSYGNGFTTTTDMTGNCDIYLVDENHEITVSKEGYKTVTVTVEDKYIGQNDFWITAKDIFLEKDIDYNRLVTNAYSETIGNGQFSIPQININSDDCEHINSEIWNTLYNGAVLEQYAYMDADVLVDYEWSVSNGILSLLVKYHHYDYAWTDYYVYNINLSNGNSLTTDDIVSSAGLTADVYKNKVKDAIGSRFWDGWERTDENFYNQSFLDTFNMCLKKTLADENIDAAIAYFNTNGQLCAVAKIYSMAAAEYYWNTINVIDYQFVPDYATEASLLTTQAELSEEEAKQKLKEWIGNLGTWVAGSENVLVCDGLYRCDGKEYYQFRLKGRVDNHSTTLTIYVISADGTEMFEGECSNGYLKKY